MATLGDLRDRIVLETVRDDLDTGGESAAALTRAISSAIDYYSDERFWFNIGSASASTVASQATLALPADIRIADSVSYDGCELKKRSLADIAHRTETGRPLYWADNGDSIRLHPIPDGVYSLTFQGIAQVDAPATDGASNIWTSEAYDLIAAHTRFILYRDVFRDPDGAMLAKGAVTEALDRLQRESRRRSRAPLRVGGVLNRLGWRAGSRATGAIE